MSGTEREKGGSPDILYAVGAVFFWSTAATAFKLSLKYIGHIELLFISSIASTIIFGSFVIFSPRKKVLGRMRPGALIFPALTGILNPFLYYIVLFRGYALLSAQEALLLNYTWPILLPLISALLLKTPVPARSLGALALGFTGIFFISSRGSGPFFSEMSPNILYPLSSAVIWGFYWVLGKKDRTEALVKLFVHFISGTLFFILFLIAGEYRMRFHPAGIAGGIYVGAFEMGFTFILWERAMAVSKKPADISILVFLSPFISLLFIALVLKEPLRAASFAGLFFIIAGIAVNRANALDFLFKKK